MYFCLLFESYVQTFILRPSHLFTTAVCTDQNHSDGWIYGGSAAAGCACNRQ